MATHPAMRHHRFDNLPRPLVVMENRWPAGVATGWHAHPKGQLLYATEGVMVVHTDAGTWVVPPNRALWMVTGLRHDVAMASEVLMRTAYIDERAIGGLPRESGVIHVSPLLRELLVAAVQIDPERPPTPREQRLLDLLVDEVRESGQLPLHLPMPQEPRLRAVCEALLARPADGASAADWARHAGVAERTLHRLFASQAGVSFAQWRAQARLLHALRRIALGDKVIDVALDCGYASPSAFAAMFRRHFGVSPTAFFA